MLLTAWTVHSLLQCNLLIAAFTTSVRASEISGHLAKEFLFFGRAKDAEESLSYNCFQVDKA